MNASAAAAAPVAASTAAPDADDRAIEVDELVEDVSIDGMCGVY